MSKTITRAIKETVADNEFGFASLVGKAVLIFTTTYIYYGTLHAVNCDVLELHDPHIVYSTGEFSAKNFSDAQALPANSFLISLGHIESMGETKTVPNA